MASRSLSAEERVVNRWIQLIAAIIAMLAISNLQYAWTLFTGLLRTALHASLPKIQVAFSKRGALESSDVPVVTRMLN